jgi:hypothetical protein
LSIIGSASYKLPDGCNYETADQTSICCYHYTGVNNNIVDMAGCFALEDINAFIDQQVTAFCDDALAIKNNCYE